MRRAGCGGSVDYLAGGEEATLVDLTSQITTGGADALTDLTTNLGSLATWLIPFIVGLLIFRKVIGAVRRG
jgi:hypothetical protein